MICKPILFPREIKENTYLIREDGVIIERETNREIVARMYNNKARQVPLSSNNGKYNVRYTLFKLYYFNFIKDPKEFYEMDYRIIRVNPIDNDHCNLNPDNFLVEIPAHARVIKNNDLNIEKQLDYPLNIPKNRYGFNKNKDLIDLYCNRIAHRFVNNHGKVSYRLYTKSNKMITIEKSRLLCFAYLLEDKHKKLKPSSIIVKYKDGNKMNTNLDNLYYKLSEEGKEMIEWGLV